MAAESATRCGNCGATIYREHIDAGIARYEGGSLLCPHCVGEYERQHDLAGSGAAQKLAPISFDEDQAKSSSHEMSESKITSFGTGATFGGKEWDEGRFARPLQPRAAGATRCRVFHSKLNEGALAFMMDQINDWLDSNEEITVKFSTSTIGIFEAKKPEPNIIVTLFY